MTPNQITGLQAFARYMVDAALEDCNVDGGTIQEIAHQYGLLTKREMKGPCSEPEEGYCACALVSGFPVECYQPTDALIAKSAPAEPISREAVGWLCTHSDGRKRIELPGSVYDQDAGWGASRVPLYTAPPSPEAECERLLDLLADWSSHFTGPKVIGGPLSSLRERTDAALAFWEMYHARS